MQQHTQMDFIATFDGSEAQRSARERLIDELDVDARVKQVLHALDKLAQGAAPKRVLNDGTETVTVKLARVQQMLGVRSETTTKTWLKIAAATPYLVIGKETHRPHTFLVRWLAIVDRQPVVQTVAGEMQASNTPPTGQVRGASVGTFGPQPQRGLTPNLAPSVVEVGPQLTPKLGGQSSNTRSLKPGSYECNSKNPVLKTGVAWGPSDGPQGDTSRKGKTPCACGCGRWFRQGFFRRWRDAIAARNLCDPMDVEELYGIAVAEGVMDHNEKNRQQVFVQAVLDVRHARNRGAIFRENVLHQRWFGNNGEDELARLMMRSADELDSAAIPLPRSASKRVEIEDSANIETDLEIPSDQTSNLQKQQAAAKLLAWQAQRELAKGTPH